MEILEISVVIEKINNMQKNQEELNLENDLIIEKLKNSLGVFTLNSDEQLQKIKDIINFLEGLELIEINDNGILEVSTKIQINKKNQFGLDTKIRKNIYQELNKFSKYNNLIKNDTVDENKLIKIIEQNKEINSFFEETKEFYSGILKEAYDNKPSRRRRLKIEETITRNQPSLFPEY